MMVWKPQKETPKKCFRIDNGRRVAVRIVCLEGHTMFQMAVVRLEGASRRRTLYLDVEDGSTIEVML